MGLVMGDLFNAYMSVLNFAKTNSEANEKFLPKPLLFHLRHPNSKTNQPKFWQNYFLRKRICQNFG